MTLTGTAQTFHTHPEYALLFPPHYNRSALIMFVDCIPTPSAYQKRSRLSARLPTPLKSGAHAGAPLHPQGATDLAIEH